MMLIGHPIYYFHYAKRFQYRHQTPNTLICNSFLHCAFPHMPTFSQYNLHFIIYSSIPAPIAHVTIYENHKQEAFV